MMARDDPPTSPERLATQGVRAALVLIFLDLDSAGPQTAAQLRVLYAAGGARPTTVARNALAAIAACEDEAIFVATTRDRASYEAAKAEQRRADGRPPGLLDGVPVAWKDLFDPKSEVTRAGSRVIGNIPAEEDAVLVQRLSAAGAVSVGKLNLSEFAFSGLGLNLNFGPPVNPRSLDEPRVPGGSSSECGVAVAHGLVPIAIGTDTSGSVRVPAALNSVVGFKSSGQRWPLEGCFPLSSTLDTAGLLCRSVTDAVIVDAAARGLGAVEPRQADLAGLRIAMPLNVVWDDVAPAVRDNCDASSTRHGTLVALEAYRLHKGRLAADAARIDRRVVAGMSAGSSTGPDNKWAIRATRARLIAEFDLLFDGNTLLAFPTVPLTAPPIAELEADDALAAATDLLMLRNTMLGNVLNWCGVSIPSGFDKGVCRPRCCCRAAPDATIICSPPPLPPSRWFVVRE